MNTRTFQDPDTVIPGRVVDWQVGKDVTDRRIFDILRHLEDSKQGFVRNVVTVTSAYLTTADDEIILGDASAGAFSIYLPAAATATGLMFSVKKVDAGGNAVTVRPVPGESIDHLNAFPLTTFEEAVTVGSNGLEWKVISHYVKTSFGMGSFSLLGFWMGGIGA